MAAKRLIAVNGNAGAFVDVLSTLHARRVEAIEDIGGQVQQGLTYKTLEDSFAASYSLGAASEPIVLGSAVAIGGGHGPILGNPAYSSGGSSISASKLLSLRSNTATPTAVRVTEYE